MEIQRADLAYRRRVMRTLIAVALLLGIGLIGLRFWLQYISSRMDTPQLVSTLRLILSACFALIAACVGALGTHLLLRGNLIVRGRRFPPVDVRAVRDTPVREGDQAVRIGRYSQAFGLVFVVIALLAAVNGWFWVSRI